MNLSDYFATAEGTGVLATADSQGRVDAAIYARPHILENGTVAMIMRERLTYRNLQENPHATYLFKETGHGYRGMRLFLEKTGENQDAELLQKLTRRSLTPEEDKARGPKHIVYFKITKALELVGDDSIIIDL